MQCPIWEATACRQFAAPDGAPCAACCVLCNRYAPAAVRAAYDAANNPAPDSVLPPSAGVPAAASTTAGMGTGFAGMTLPGQTSSSVFANPPPSAEGGMTPPAAGASDSVFANSGSLWNNKYTPSVGNAIGSSDILVKMIIDAPEQQVATSGDKLRNMFANYTQTPLANVYVYQTRTINGAAGQPSLDVSTLFSTAHLLTCIGAAACSSNSRSGLLPALVLMQKQLKLCCQLRKIQQGSAFLSSHKVHCSLQVS